MSSITSCAACAPVSSSSTSSIIFLSGRRRDVEAIFAVLRRLGREYDISPALVGEAAVYDHIHLTDEMASRFALAPVPRWRHGEDDLALLDSLEAALPLARASRLSDETIARAIFALSERLIGEIVGIVTRAATEAHAGWRRADHERPRSRRSRMFRFRAGAARRSARLCCDEVDGSRVARDRSPTP